MKKNFRLFALAITALFAAFHAKAQNDFITKWLFAANTTSLTVFVNTSGNVNYSWSCTPSGNTGSGTFNAFTIVNTTIPINAVAGDVLILTINPTNFKSMIFKNSPAGGSLSGDNLYEVTQWGAQVKWKSMNSMFFGCNNLNITATDAPNLTEPPPLLVLT